MSGHRQTPVPGVRAPVLTSTPPRLAGAEEDATIAGRIGDQGLAAIPMSSSASSVAALRRNLESYGFTQVSMDPRFNFDNFRNNMQGVSSVVVKDQTSQKERRVLIVRTRSACFLLLDEPFNDLQNGHLGLMSANFNNYGILQADGRKNWYICLITTNTLKLLLHVQEKPKPSATAVPASDTLIQRGETVDRNLLSRQLQAAIVSNSTGETFDLGAVARDIKFALIFRHESGGCTYYIIAGDEENSYWLHVNVETPKPPDPCVATVVLTYKHESAVLFRED